MSLVDVPMERLKWFQFPSNGKVYSKHFFAKIHTKSPKFQFPSNGKVYSKFSDAGNPRKTQWLLFQFPSNGKVDSKSRKSVTMQRKTMSVSIPFKRESVFKAAEAIAIARMMYVFQFPSNGKVDSKFRQPSLLQRRIECVSIPFKRESVFKDVVTCIRGQSDLLEFQFPSNGKVDSKT